MTNKAKWIGILVVLGAACGPAAPTDAALEQQMVEVNGKIPLTEEQMQALMDEAMKNPPVFQASVCPAANSCNESIYGSYAAWSSWQTCGSSSTCNVRGCNLVCDVYDDVHKTCIREGSSSQSSYRYQQRWDVYGNPCMNVELSTNTVCGCNL